MQTQDNTTRVIIEKTEELGKKPLRHPPSGNYPLENQLGYMNSNRPSKPNLSNAPKPSKLLAPIRLHRTMSSLAFRISRLAHCINQYELVLSWTASQTPRTFSLLWIWWGKDLAKAPLKDMPMERVRVEEFENQKYKIMDESILLFSRVSLSKLSL